MAVRQESGLPVSGFGTSAHYGPLFWELSFWGSLLFATIETALCTERINHGGRILGPLPVVTNAVLFNTPEADAIVSALQIFPRDNPWNEEVTRRPRLANSDAMIAQITSELLSTRRTLRAFYEMNFVVVPDNQPLMLIDFFNWPEESDPSPYPIPPNMPVETWPRETGGLTLAQWQEDINDEGGDRHSIIVQPGTGGIWETWLTKRVGSDWEASNGAKFDLNSNATRPAGWTAGDAAGLSMFAGLVRYDECERGMVEHAIRIIVKHTRRAYIYPATHHASVPSTTDPNVPAMGQRLRLKQNFVVPDHWTKHEKAVLKALKKYGAIVADNGNFFSISVAPDQRFPEDAFSNLSSVAISNFEVIQTTGPSEGPRSPGAPIVNAGPDQMVHISQVAVLSGAATFTQPAQIQWKLYSGPGTVAFADASRTNTTATFSTRGTYRLMLSADDGVHAIAHDAMTVTVGATIRTTLAHVGTNVVLRWTGGEAPYELQRTTDLTPPGWQTVLTTTASAAAIPNSGETAFFRIKGR